MSETQAKERKPYIWRIEGILTSIAPFHIGDGEVTHRKDLVKEEPGGKKASVDISSVVTDHRGAAYIPGSTIKGNLRSWLEGNNIEPNLVKEVFGGKDTKEKEAAGGKAEFLDAFSADNPSSFKHEPLFWDCTRLTGVTTCVAIDRFTGAASEKKLFHLEYVPPGVSFDVVIELRGLENGNYGEQEKEVILLLRALEAFNSNGRFRPVTLGSSTANGWGRFRWELKAIKRLDAEKIEEWLKRPGPLSSMLADLDNKQELLGKARKENEKVETPLLKIDVDLAFDSPFLVNEARKKSDKEKNEKKGVEPDFTPRRNADGMVILPAESFRGAMRSQAEKIVRTIGGRACFPERPGDACNDIKDLCIVCRTFGAAGVKSPITISDFVQKNKEKPLTQEFVSIDRFTGGGAEGRKFNAEAVLDPLLSGTIEVDLDRKAASRGIDLACIGLLALVFRDLEEGDVTFGHGAARGYGFCTGKIKVTACGMDGPKHLSNQEGADKNPYGEKLSFLEEVGKLFLYNYLKKENKDA